jgi:ABC-type transport system substrate-binding protein
MRRAGALLVVLALAACGGGTTGKKAAQTGQATTTAGEAALSRGGTLRAAAVSWPRLVELYSTPGGEVHYLLDPQVTIDYASLELFRCCLLRTLMSTDFVRALERELGPAPSAWAGGPLGSFANYYAPLIVGAQAFADGMASSISGLETPDDSTLVVHLTQPSGDLGARFSMPGTAPIPPGAADGRENGYTPPFLATSGPYMVERYDPATSLTLVRSLAWDRATDDLRNAYVDRIELALGGDKDAAYRKVESGALDVVYDADPPTELVRRYESESRLRSRVAIFPLDGVRYLTLNVAAPPFDDLHVRRAVSLAVDKAALRRTELGPFGGVVATHIAPDSLENNLLLDYDPYATPGGRGDLRAARSEMAQSRYDRDGDGVCDDPACRNVPSLTRAEDEFRGLAPLVENALGQLGITLDLEALDRDHLDARLAVHKKHVALTIGRGYTKDFPGASSWFPSLFADSSLSESLVRASPEQLKRWGYGSVAAPSVDGKIDECLGLVGGAQFGCWADLDQYLMEQVVPWVPYAQLTSTRIVSERVASFSVDQAFVEPALDRFALQGGGGS